MLYGEVVALDKAIPMCDSENQETRKPGALYPNMVIYGFPLNSIYFTINNALVNYRNEISSNISVSHFDYFI